MYYRLMLIGGGMFRDLITRGALVVFTELYIRVEASFSTFVPKRNRIRLEPLLEDARKIVQYAQDRLHHGETNVNGYLFICMAMAQLQAMLDGSSVQEATANAANECLETCKNILEGVMINSFPKNNPQVDVQLTTYDDTFYPPADFEVDLDFLGCGNGAVNLMDPFIVQQWAGQA
jgi:hypothetical protein